MRSFLIFCALLWSTFGAWAASPVPDPVDMDPALPAKLASARDSGASSLIPEPTAALLAGLGGLALLLFVKRRK